MSFVFDFFFKKAIILGYVVTVLLYFMYQTVENFGCLQVLFANLLV